MTVKSNIGNENRASEVRGAQEENGDFSNLDGHGLPRQREEEGEPQSERVLGTDGEATNELAHRLYSGGRLNQGALESYIKKLISRLELVENQMASIKEKYNGYTNSHRDRLLQRLVENEKFAREVEEEEAKTTEETESLKKELLELERVLGVSKIEEK